MRSVRYGSQRAAMASANNRVEGLELVTDPDKRAIFNDTSVESLGRLGLHNLTITGIVRLLARDRLRGGNVHAAQRRYPGGGCPWV